MPLLSVAHELTHVAFDLLKQIQACPREWGVHSVFPSLPRTPKDPPPPSIFATCRPITCSIILLWLF
jgi:hypothetical protein